MTSWLVDKMSTWWFDKMKTWLHDYLMCWLELFDHWKIPEKSVFMIWKNSKKQTKQIQLNHSFFHWMMTTVLFIAVSLVISINSNEFIILSIAVRSFSSTLQICYHPHWIMKLSQWIHYFQRRNWTNAWFNFLSLCLFPVSVLTNCNGWNSFHSIQYALYNQQ